MFDINKMTKDEKTKLCISLLKDTDVFTTIEIVHAGEEYDANFYVNDIEVLPNSLQDRL
jgi:hypothetical protein